MSDAFKRVEAYDCPMSTCAAPAGSLPRTGKGKATMQYRTARLRLVPQLAKVLSVPTPAVRKPGSVWTELPRPMSAGTKPVGHVRLGYARASTARQSFDAHKRLGRGIELATLAEELKASDVGLEFLTGELRGSHDPSGIVFTVLAAMSGMEREYIRDGPLKATSPPASAARPSAARASPTRTCCPWPSTGTKKGQHPSRVCGWCLSQGSSQGKAKGRSEDVREGPFPGHAHRGTRSSSRARCYPPEGQ
ncbi:hypothetical protein [Streptomyces sp. NPDC020747]|uniref:hypothetical protein n=1 Tax=Streptomyces sp. NPDC020747 TaxID=3365086 RepID=UPI00378A6AAC